MQASIQCPSAANVCVVIPHYRATLTPTERFSLDRCTQVLSQHRRVLVVPEHLATDSLMEVAGGAAVERFADRYFAGIAGYNQLMLSDEFYARFAQYEFILIYQLDALVFDDQLHRWCAAGYDYIGAPWLRETDTGRPVRRARRQLRASLYRWMDRREAGGALHPSQFDGAVGNGGFSLRRVAAMRAALARFEGDPRLARYLESRIPVRDKTANEDLFFGVEVNRRGRYLRIPAVAEAAAFAWESAPEQACARSGVSLPFGCHAWDHMYPEFWRAKFAAAGIDTGIFELDAGPVPHSLGIVRD